MDETFNMKIYYVQITKVIICEKANKITVPTDKTKKKPNNKIRR